MEGLGCGLGRDRLAGSGINFPFGNGPECQRPMAYIGQVQCPAEQVKSHRDKDFWNQTVVSVSKEENRTKSHTRFLEGEVAGAAGDRRGIHSSACIR